MLPEQNFASTRRCRSRTAMLDQKAEKKKKKPKHSPCSHLGYTRQNLVRAENDQRRPAREPGPCPATPNHLMLNTDVATTRSAKTNNDVPNREPSGKGPTGAEQTASNDGAVT